MAIAPIVTLTGGKPPSDPQFWLDAATQAVRTFCNWHVAPAIDEILELTARGPHTLFLPTGKINSITEVLNDGVDVTAEVQVDKFGFLQLSGCWSLKLGAIQVTMNHGYDLDEVGDLAGIIARLAGRAASTSSNVVAQRAGGMSVNYATANGLPVGSGLFATEMAELSPYRITVY